MQSLFFIFLFLPVTQGVLDVQTLAAKLLETKLIFS